MLLQLPGPAPDLVLISLFMFVIIYFFFWRISNRPQVFGAIESSRPRRATFVANAIIASGYLVFLLSLLSQSDFVQSPQEYVIPLSLAGVLLVLIFLDLTRQYKKL